MEVGKVYALSEKGRDKLHQAMKLTVNNNTRVTVVGGKRLCNNWGGGSGPAHADNCASRYQWMEVNNIEATEVLLSADDIREV